MLITPKYRTTSWEIEAGKEADLASLVAPQFPWTLGLDPYTSSPL